MNIKLLWLCPYSLESFEEQKGHHLIHPSCQHRLKVWLFHGQISHTAQDMQLISGDLPFLESAIKDEDEILKQRDFNRLCLQYTYK